MWILLLLVVIAALITVIVYHACTLQIVTGANDVSPRPALDRSNQLVQPALVKFRKNASCTPEKGSEFCKSTREFHDHIAEEHPDRIIVVEHYADWCHYCDNQRPIFNQILNEMMNGTENKCYYITSNDIDKHPVGGIKSIPAIIKRSLDGKLSKYKGPSTDPDAIKKWILAAA